MVELIVGLDRRRFEPTVICLEAGGAHEATLQAANVPIEVLGYEGFRIFRHPLRTLGQLARLVRLLRRHRPQIVHAQLFWAYVIGAYAARVARVPWVLASRVGLSRFRSSLPRHWLRLERGATARCDLLVAVSEGVRRDTIASEGVPDDKVVVVYYGIDTAPFSSARPAPRESLAAGTGPVVLTLANLIHYKGHTYLLDAWKRVNGRFPDATLLLVGEGPMRPALEQRVSELGLARSVRLLGSQSAVAEILAACDLLVHPSLEEGFCNAILEAMAAGKAVVATDVGGNAEAVQDGVTGLVVPAADSDALASAMESLLGDPGRRERYGTAGRARVEKHFRMDVMVKRFEVFYEALVSGGPAAARNALRDLAPDRI